MKKTTFNQAGFEHVTLLVILVLVVAIGAVGFRVANKPAVKNTVQSKTTPAAPPETLKSKSDVTSTKNSLNTEQVETDLNPAQLDKDLSDLR